MTDKDFTQYKLKEIKKTTQIEWFFYYVGFFNYKQFPTF